MEMKLYPIMVNLSGKRVLVVGGGAVASRKIADLLACGALVTIIAPEIDDSIVQLKESNPERVDVQKRNYAPGDCAGALLVFSAADNAAVNQQVFQEARERGIFVNAADDPPNCSFFVPSWFNRDALIVAVSTTGVSPSLAARMRRKIEDVIPDNIEDVLSALEQVRAMLKNDPDYLALNTETRGAILKKIVNDDGLLSGLVRCHKDKTLKIFIKNLSSN